MNARELRWRFGTTLGVPLAAGAIALLSKLARVEHVDKQHDTDAIESSKAVIYAFWHGRFWLLPLHLGHSGITVLVSRSRDGEVITRILGKLGHHAVRGSSSRGGREALTALESVLAGGDSVALTPDGPRGPRHRAQVGTVALAARTGCPVVPVGVAASPAWTLSSWDRFQIPKPRARGVVVFGEPLRVPAGEELEPWRLRLETTLVELESRADAAVLR